MCGIYGLVDYQKDIDERLCMEKMGKSMLHRGPDCKAYRCINSNYSKISLGHNRLSIIDLSPEANQPFEIDGYILVFNGEIYNYLELKTQQEALGQIFSTNSDTEVLLRLYIRKGLDFVNDLNGMFAFSIYDPNRNKVFLFRDRMGVKPLYYFSDDSKFMFSSELKGIMSSGLMNKIIDNEALLSFFRFGYVPREGCILKGASKLLPGSYLELCLKSNSIDLHEYWNPAKAFHSNKVGIEDKERVTKELKELLSSSCNYRMISDVPVGVFLSGGYDSSLVTALLSESGHKVKTYTIGFEDPKYDESAYAKDIASYLGTSHTTSICSIEDVKVIIEDLPDIYDEPFGDYSSIPTLLVSKIASNDVTVVLSADGGDETFGGYNKYTKALVNYKTIKKFPKWLFKLLDYSKAYKILKAFPKYSHRLEHKMDVFRNVLINNNDEYTLAKLSSHRISKSEELDLFLKEVSLAPKDENQDFQKLTGLSKLINFDYQYYLPDDILTKVDRATMAYSIEGRDPLLDYRIVEFAAKLDDDFKINNGSKKDIIKDILHSMVPQKLLDRPKKGFGLPLDEWFKTDLKYLFDEHVFNFNFEKQQIFNGEYVRNRVSNFIDGSHEDWDFAWHMLVFQMWYKRWLN